VMLATSSATFCMLDQACCNALRTRMGSPETYSFVWRTLA